MSRQVYRIYLAVIVAAYVLSGTLYAALTPAWQVPDEPAHYNYIRSLAEGRGFPVIEPGDYDQAYLSRLTTEKFPPELPVTRLEYEDHQPPLYYLLATPLYLSFNGALLPLRLLSVLFGTGILVVAAGTIRAIFPARSDLALMTAAFIAFIPQHVAMSAGVNNDALAELIAGATLWVLAGYIQQDRMRPWLPGILLGAVLLTKTTIYALLGVALVAVWMRRRLQGHTWAWAGREMAWMLIPALLVSAPWFIRNICVYGWGDPLALARHNAIVEGQPRSAEWLAGYGWSGLLLRMARTTFQSFWGQFGWMGVVLPQRYYVLLALFTIGALLGCAHWVFRGEELSGAQRAGLGLLLTLFLLTVLAFLGYNLTFVQHQGRYLYPALIPIGLAFALGIDRWRQVLPKGLRCPATTVLFAAWAAFDLYCLFTFVIPFLRR
ncbi:MAG: glycosyltransferase family 39 protein [Anaerolineae bacterium]|nr:glycosyltransferase family 39 protein [Anaerolineae bacterium]